MKKKSRLLAHLSPSGPRVGIVSHSALAAHGNLSPRYWLGDGTQEGEARAELFRRCGLVAPPEGKPMIKPFVIEPDGTMRDAVPTGSRWSLDELQKLVGGYIETLRVHGCLLVFDEEGRLKAKPRNRLASILANVELVGTVVVLRDGDLE